LLVAFQRWEEERMRRTWLICSTMVLWVLIASPWAAAEDAQEPQAEDTMEYQEGGVAATELTADTFTTEWGAFGTFRFVETEPDDLTLTRLGGTVSVSTWEVRTDRYPLPIARYMAYAPHLDLFAGYALLSDGDDATGPTIGASLRMAHPESYYNARIYFDHVQAERDENYPALDLSGGAPGVPTTVAGDLQRSWTTLGAEFGFWNYEEPRQELGVFYEQEVFRRDPAVNSGTDIVIDPATADDASRTRQLTFGIYGVHITRNQRWRYRARVAGTGYATVSGPEVFPGDRYEDELNGLIKFDLDWMPSRLVLFGAGAELEFGGNKASEHTAVFGRTEFNFGPALAIRAEAGWFYPLEDDYGRDELKVSGALILRN
jgi:hypothetical protein